ncbi:DUF3025 domain-containing protein [Orrella daihaiensis]|uniref:DUF3025 domain-containing protein n=1 Tax=Orrella daihaiensis TaxID=2782176 RepID=A0ABY4AL07_9BURK|nr:DUF3025 domain-containing protein [Orrella daihaiensis]UOD49780.1 DUF3025 domain-containing protein [Orrella daihaiensis]
MMSTPIAIQTSNKLESLVSTAPALWLGLHSTLAKFQNTPDITTLNEAANKAGLTNRLGMPLQFIAQTKPCGQRDYETQIYHQGMIPTRPGHWHDIFNACMWLTYPKTKAALNTVHLREPTTTGRTPASDAATLFDESGAILIGPDPRLAQWLIDHDWKTAFVTHRDLWQTHHLLVIGHAVLEKLANPYPGMIAKVIYQPWSALSKDDLMAPPPALDQIIAQRWHDGEFKRPSQLFPMPVLGVPGTDTSNENPAYYDNTLVFRAKRKL